MPFLRYAQSMSGICTSGNSCFDAATPAPTMVSGSEKFLERTFEALFLYDYM